MKKRIFLPGQLGLVLVWMLCLGLRAQNSTPEAPGSIAVLEEKLRSNPSPSEELALNSKLAEGYLYINAEKAQKHGQRALKLAIAQNNPGLKCKSLAILGKAHLVSSDYIEAINHFVRAKAIALPSKDTLLTDICNGLGIVYQYFLEYDLAIAEFQGAIQFATEYQLPQKAVYPLGNLADLFRQRGEFEKAREFLNRARSLAAHSTEKRDMGFVCKDLSFIFIRLNRLDSARILARQAVEITENEYPYIACDAYVNLSTIERLEGNSPLALQYALKGKELALQVDAKKFASRADLAIINHYLQEPDHSTAASVSKAALEFAERHQLVDETLKIYRLQEDIHAANGQFRRAYATGKIIDSLENQAFDRDREKRAVLAELRLKTELSAQENQSLKKQIHAGEQLLRQSNLFALTLFFFSGIAFLSLFYLFRQGYFQDPEMSHDFVTDEEATRLTFVRQMGMIGFVLVAFIFLYFCFHNHSRGIFFSLSALAILAINYLLALRKNLKIVLYLSIATFYSIIVLGIFGFHKIYSMPLAILASFIQISFLCTRLSQQILNLVVGVGVFVLCLYRLYLMPELELVPISQSHPGLEFMIAVTCLIVIVATVIYFSRNIIAFKSELWKSNQFLTQIANVNPHFVFAKDTRRKFTFVNKALCDTYGMTRQQMLGKRDEEIHPIFSDDGHFVEDDLKILKTGSTIYRKEERIWDVNNREKWLSTIKNPIRNDHGEIVGILAVATDITENKKQEEVIASQLADLNQKNRQLKKYIDSNMELENFAYIASHDLRTPVRTLISFSQLLEKNLAGKLDERAREYLHFIKSASSNMNQLINDLLMYSRVNNARVKIEEVDLRRLLEELTAEMQTSIDEKFARIEISALPPVLCGDPTKLRQLFQNLLTNALKFSKSNVRPHIRISAEERPASWRFTVRDNGIGINKEFHQRIFLLFKRLHSQEEIEGTGIGLALCKKIVDQHQGNIWVESEEGIGTSFLFTISKKLQPVEPVLQTED